MKEYAALGFLVGAIDSEGKRPFLPCDSPATRFQVVFEDDGANGSRPGVPVAIGWSEDGRAAAVLGRVTGGRNRSRLVS